MAQYFDAYRIDHILGFFRIWEIPTTQKTGLLGHFYPALPLSKEELSSRGLWDIKRMTEPFIQPHLLKTWWGEKSAEKAKLYFDAVCVFHRAGDRCTGGHLLL